MYGTRDRQGRIASGAPLESSSSLFENRRAARGMKGKRCQIPVLYLYMLKEAFVCIALEIGRAASPRAPWRAAAAWPKTGARHAE
jgi:hypothetical protein